MSKTLAIVAGSFHKESDLMIQFACDAASAAGLSVVKVLKVPGSMEKPLAVQLLLKQPKVDSVAVLGIIEKGETKHGLVMGVGVVNALIKLQLDFEKPVGIGILGPEIHPSQIPSRLKGYSEAAVNAVAHMLSLDVTV